MLRLTADEMKAIVASYQTDDKLLKMEQYLIETTERIRTQMAQRRAQLVLDARIKKTKKHRVAMDKRFLTRIYGERRPVIKREESLAAQPPPEPEEPDDDGEG